MPRFAALILAFLLLGEAASRLLHLPLPGPVAGMAGLYLWLSLRGPPDDALRDASHKFLRYLPLLFVPAGVGVIEHLDLLGREGVAILAALAVSTALAMAVTAGVLQLLLRRRQ